jgi:hypothetical protein
MQISFDLDWKNGLVLPPGQGVHFFMPNLSAYVPGEHFLQ